MTHGTAVGKIDESSRGRGTGLRESGNGLPEDYALVRLGSSTRMCYRFTGETGVTIRSSRGREPRQCLPSIGKSDSPRLKHTDMAGRSSGN